MPVFSVYGKYIFIGVPVRQLNYFSVWNSIAKKIFATIKNVSYNHKLH